jgi:signal transduction histidine kinase
MPVPQENLSFVERAGEPVLENGARCEFQPFIQGYASTTRK